MYLLKSPVYPLFVVLFLSEWSNMIYFKFYYLVHFWWCYLGVAGASYIPTVQAALPRLLGAAAPPGAGARENRRQCLKVILALLIFDTLYLKMKIDWFCCFTRFCASGLRGKFFLTLYCGVTWTILEFQMMKHLLDFLLGVHLDLSALLMILSEKWKACWLMSTAGINLSSLWFI